MADEEEKRLERLSRELGMLNRELEQACKRVGIDPGDLKSVVVTALARQPHAVQLRGLRSETGFDVAQALPVRHLGECHDAKLFAATKTANPNIAAIPRHDSLKTRPRHKIHNLREQRPPQVHGHASDQKNRATYRDSANPSSNRHQIKLASTYCFTAPIQPTPST